MYEKFYKFRIEEVVVALICAIGSLYGIGAL